MTAVKVAKKEWMDGYDFLVCDLSFDGSIHAIGTVVEMKKHEPGTFIGQGTFQLDQKNAQALMNEMWAAGLRPTEAKYPQGEINAMKEHLSDMRKLVFKP